MSWDIVESELIEWLKSYEGPRYHAVLSDPPYALISITKRFGKAGSAAAQEGSDGRYSRLSGGFMGQKWDGFESLAHYQKWVSEWSKLMIERLLYPGAVCLFFGGTRTFHHLGVGLENGGFEIVDSILIPWIHGQGFPKSHDISKGLDKAAGEERKIVGYGDTKRAPQIQPYSQGAGGAADTRAITSPCTPDAETWDGYGTALKPSFEAVLVARAPLSQSAELGIILRSLNLLEARLWSLLPAKTVENALVSSPLGYEGVLDSAQWTVDEKNNISVDLLGQMDMSLLGEAINTCLNTVRSWKNCLADLFEQRSMSITETASDTIIDLKTLRSFLLDITPQSIIQVAIQADGSKLDALPVTRYLNATLVKLNATRELSALATAIKLVEGSDLLPNWEPIFLCRAPRGDKTFAQLAVEFGTGALNIDGSRIEGPPPHHDEAGRPSGKTSLPGESDIKHSDPSGRWPANFILSHAEDCVKVGEYETKDRVINRWKDGMLPFGGGAGQEYETIDPSRAGEPSAERTYEHMGGTDFAMKPGARRGMELVDLYACVPGCPVRALDDQAGELKSGAGPIVRSADKTRHVYGKFEGQRVEHLRPANTGGPSRFFYTAKASRSEKDKGLEHFWWKRTDDGFERISLNEYEQLDKKERAHGCIHPTVKPLELLRYLATLLLPPTVTKSDHSAEKHKWRILVPFSGSGSEMIGALQAGWDEVTGIEMDSNYVMMAEARISATIGMF